MIETTKQEVHASTSVLLDAISDATGSKPVELMIPAHLIRIPGDPNRDEHSFHDESFERLVESIDATRGNTQHVHIEQRIGADGQIEHWLISGHRRVRACLRTGWLVKALVTQHAEERSSYVSRITENANRKDPSPFERGRQIEQGFQDKLYKLESEAARMVGVDKSDLSKLRRLGRLDQRIVGAFAASSELQFKHAKPLTDAVAANPNAVLAEADRIAALGTKPSANEVVALLVAAASVGVVGPSHTPTMDLPLCCDGQQVGRIRVAKNGTVKIELDVPLERKQRESLVKTLEAFVRRRVLNLPAAITKPEAQQ